MAGEQEDQVVTTSSTGELTSKADAGALITEDSTIEPIASLDPGSDIVKIEDPSTTTETETDIKSNIETNGKVVDSSEAEGVSVDMEMTDVTRADTESSIKEEQITTTSTKEVTEDAPSNIESTQVDQVEGSSKKNETGDSPLIVDPFKTAVSQLYAGKRYLLVKDIPLAVTSLSEACRSLSDLTGIFSPESGEAHYFYGKSLLEQARTELSVFETPGVPADSAKSGDEEDDEEEEMEEDDGGEGESEDKVKEKEGEEMGEDVDVTTEDNDAGKRSDSETDDQKQNGQKVLEDEDLNAPSPKTEGATTLLPADAEKPGTSSGIVDPDPDVTAPEDELTNLELAWEVLEVSKVAYKRLVDEAAEKLTMSDKTDLEVAEKLLNVWKSKLANVHSMLGEVATESEQYTQAVEEINTSLAILAEIEELDSREIAQCQFQLGIAYSFDRKFDDAIKSFKTSSELIETRIKNLQTKLDSNVVEEVEGSLSSSSGSTNEFDPDAEPKTQLASDEILETDIVEIAELKALLPELQEKINDTLDAQKDAARVCEEEKQDQEMIQRNSPVKNPNPPAVNDISHLVKKKKKAEDLLEQEPPSKKACTEEPDSSTQSNGSHEATNGTSTVTE